MNSLHIKNYKNLEDSRIDKLGRVNTINNPYGILLISPAIDRFM